MKRNNRNFYSRGWMIALASIAFPSVFMQASAKTPYSLRCVQALEYVAPNDKKESLETKRPQVDKRLFRSKVIDKRIEQVKKMLKNPYMAWMFENCFPNTLDTTIHYEKKPDGTDDTFVITGDIPAMWLRDSGAQVWPYLPFCAKDEGVRHMVRGVILRQLKCILIDPYANAFNKEATGSEWQTDYTKMKPELHERKWEIDSLCYPLRLAYEYWKVTGDAAIFDAEWQRAVELIVQTFREQQRKDGNRTPYTFARKTHALHDTVSNYGYGHPANPVGLIASTFRPSDDSSVFPFLVPSNFFAVSVLRKAAEILTTVNQNQTLAAECTSLAREVNDALQQYAVVAHPKYGKIYAFEVDGFGSSLLMDDANVPSLLALPYLTDVPIDDPVYQNTRRFVWSTDNPYFFKGKAGEGIGGPHVGLDYAWPMSIIMRAFTATSDAEIKDCLNMLLQTDGGTGFIHEAFHKDDDTKFTRAWFAWSNTLFGELVLKLVDDGKLDLLNAVTGKSDVVKKEYEKSK